MTDPELRARLAALRPPSPSEAAQSRALFRAHLALDHAARSPSPAPEAKKANRFVLLPGLPLLAPLAAALLLALGLWTTPPASSPSAEPSLAASRDLLTQLHSLFPGQLNAVIDRDGTLQLDLSAASSLPPAADDQAVVVELRRDGHHLRILAYSGRPVSLELDGVSLRLDPLLTSDGDVLLAGDSFVWSSAHPAASDALPGWRIAARPLDLPL